MADSDKELKIKILTSAETQSLQDYNADLRKITGSINEETETTLRNAAAATESSGTHWELRRAFESLSQFIPGLGPVAGLVGEGFRDMGEGAEGAAAGIDTLITTLGPVAIVILSIQTAITYWDLFTSKAKEASEAFTQASKEIDEAAQKAISSWDELQDTLAGKDKSITKQYREELQRRREIGEATNSQIEEAIKAREQAELEAAGDNAVAKIEIQKKYEDQLRVLRINSTDYFRFQEADIAQNAQDDLNRRLAQIDADKKRLAAVPGYDYDTRSRMLRSIGEESKQATDLAEYINELKGQAATDATVIGIREAGLAQVRQIEDRSTFETGVRAALGDFGPKLNAKQEEALDRVQATFQNVHGSLDAWLGYLREFQLTAGQKLQAIDTEFQRIRQTTAAMANGTASTIQ